MAAPAAPTAEQLNALLKNNLRRCEAQGEYLRKMQKDGKWGPIMAARDRLDELLDERNALRARL